MSVRRGLIAGALLLALGTSARADYDYSVVVTVLSTSGTAPPGDLVITPVSGGPLTTSNTVSTANLTLTSANVGASQTLTVMYREDLTITNPAPAGATGTTSIFGTLSISNLTSRSAITSNKFTSVTNGTLTVGGDNFVVSVGALGFNNIDFQSPTVNGSVGGLSGTITITVPEPASFSLAGMGIAGLLGYRWRRRETARRAKVA